MLHIKDEKALAYGLEIALRRHDEEQKRTEGLNTRAISLVGYAAGIGALYFNLMVNSLFKSFLLMLLTSSVFLIEFIVILFCLSVYNILLEKKFLTGPGGNILNLASKKRTENELKTELLASYTKAYNANYEANLLSSKRLRWATILFALGFLVGSISFSINLIV